MKQLSQDALVNLRDAEDWNALWLAAVPLVKLAIRKMMQTGEVAPSGVRDDLMQEGYLAAGRAVRSWVPWESRFSTWVVAQVRWAVLNYITGENSGMVGSRKAHMQRVGMEEHEAFPAEGDGADAPHAAGDTTGQGEQVDGTLGGWLTYGGVVLGRCHGRQSSSYAVDGGRVSNYGGTGAGEIPAGFNDPAYEAELLETRNFVLQLRNPREREALIAWTEGGSKALREMADERSMSMQMARRYVRNAREKVRNRFREKGHTTFEGKAKRAK